MRIAKYALVAALTLASGAAFAGAKQDRATDAVKRGSVQSVAMERDAGSQPLGVFGLPRTKPTIFGHEPLQLQYDRPHVNNG